MEDQKERIIILLSLYAEDRITRRELDELLGYIADARHDGTLHDYLLAEWEGLDTGRALPEPNWDKMLNSITGKPNQQAESEQNQYEYNENHKNNIRRLRWTRYAIAASVLIAIGTSTIFLLNQRHPQGTTTEHDVAPYTAQAILKTGGKTIVLDKTQNGKIAQTNVTKSQGEQLAYAITPATQTIQYDTIQIPKGGRPYTVQLSDGTKLTLNAATTVRYPETFAGNKREGVELISGEIYAEVTHNEKQPFSIKAPGQLIQDIGTEFNMSAYEDESEYRTTLVTGAITINRHDITPGNEAIISGENIAIRKANIEQTIAWKQNDFYFNGEHIDVIMRQLARWYNIEVKYEGKMTSEVFFARINRKKNISSVLRLLEKTQKIHFKIEGRRVTVLSKK